MTRVYIGLGSNIERDANVRGGISELKKHFGDLVISSVYESPAYGFEGDNFYNLVAGFDTELSVEKLSAVLRDIEYAFGRKSNAIRFSSRTLDLDLLLYDDLIRHDEKFDLPRADIMHYTFTLCPLAEIAGEKRHPEIGQSFADLWQSFDKSNQDLWPVEFRASNG